MQNIPPMPVRSKDPIDTFLKYKITEVLKENPSSKEEFTARMLHPFIACICAKVLINPNPDPANPMRVWATTQQALSRGVFAIVSVQELISIREDFRDELVAKAAAQLMNYVKRINVPVMRFILGTAVHQSLEDRRMSVVHSSWAISQLFKFTAQNILAKNRDLSISDSIWGINEFSPLPVTDVEQRYIATSSFNDFIESSAMFNVRSTPMRVPTPVEIIAVIQDNDNAQPIPPIRRPIDTLSIARKLSGNQRCIEIPDFDGAANICFPNVPSRPSRNAKFTKLLVKLGFQRAFIKIKDSWYLRSTTAPLLDTKVLFLEDDATLPAKTREFWHDLTVGDDSLSGRLLENNPNPYAERFKVVDMHKVAKRVTSTK